MTVNGEAGTDFNHAYTCTPPQITKTTTTKPPNKNAWFVYS